jgi:hypothetical protein
MSDKLGLNNTGTSKGFKIIMWLVLLGFIAIVIAMIGPEFF